MSIQTIKECIMNCGNEMHFTYKGKMSGVEPEVKNSVFTFQVWHGRNIKEYKDFYSMVTDKFYSGKSIVDLLREGVEFSFS